MPSCRTAAYNAAVEGDAVTMQELVDSGATLNRQNVLGEQDGQKMNPLRFLIVDFPAAILALAWDIGTLGTFGTHSFTARMHANQCETPIDEACKRGYADVTRILLKAGEKPCSSSVQEAVSGNKLGVVQELLDNNNIGPNWQYNDWPILLWAARDGATDVTRLLIQRGAFVNHKDSDDRTALWLAAYNAQVRDARALLEAGANVHAVLDQAHHNGDADKGITVVKTLVSAGVPKSVFAAHYLYGRSDSALALAITRAGYQAPPPAPPQQPAKVEIKETPRTVALPTARTKTKSTARNQTKPARARFAAPLKSNTPKKQTKQAKPAAPKAKPSRSSILKDFR